MTNTSQIVRRNASRRTLVLTLLVSTLVACSTPSSQDNKVVPAGWLKDTTPQLPERDRTPAQSAVPTEEPVQKNRFFQTPALPERKVPPAQTVAPYKQEDETGKQASVAFDGMPLPQFISSVFGVILKKTIALDPQIQQRRDLVSMRAGKPQTTGQLYESAKTVLRAYGITVQELPGLTRFVPDNSDAGSLPEIRRGRAMPEVPETLRPQFHLIEMENTQAPQVASWLRNIYKDKITVQEETARNALVISGTPLNVSAAMQAIIALDQPLMRGRLAARITPLYWTAEELSKRIYDVLTAEGYFAGTAAGSNAPVVLLPIGSINSVIVFANSQALLDHIMRWAEDMDQPSQTRSGNYFIYPVRHADATDIAATLSQVLGGGTTTTTTAATGQTTTARSGRIVVNKSTNSLILQASATEYQQWLSLLQELDRPAKSALVTVSVAEVRLKDGEKFGFEWLVNNLRIGGLGGTLSTMKSWSTSGIGGLALSLGDAASPTVILNALASSSQARILSNPSILTRSGEEASITIGQEVPVVTSQVNNGTTTSSGTATVTQSIQYRNTGVIMKVKPVVRAGGRIDLTVNQEVSSVSTTKVGAAESPSIDTRKLETKLTVRDGNTVVLGGLMSDSQSGTDTGIPYAKDIPLLGHLFKGNSKDNDRTELVMLITAYAIEDDFDVESITEAFRKRFPWTAPLYQSTPITKDTTSKALANTTDPASRPTTTSKPYERPAINEDVSFAPASTRPATATTATYMNSGSSTAPATPAPVVTAPLPGGAKGSLVTDDELKKELMQALQGMKKP